MKTAEYNGWLYRVQCRFESERIYRQWAESNPYEAYERNPDLFWHFFGRFFEQQGFTRAQVDQL